MNVPPFIKQIFQTYVARLLAMVLGVAFTIIVSRTLGPEGRGWVATATTLAGMGTIFASLGLPQVNAYYSAKDPQSRAALLGNSLVASLVLTVALGLIFYLGNALASDFIRLPGIFLPLTVLYAGLQLSITLLQQLMVGMDLVRDYNCSEIIVRGLQLLGVVALAWGGWNEADKYFACSTGAFLPAIIIGTYICAKNFPERITCSYKLFKETATYSSRLYAVAVFFNIFMGLDLLLTNRYLGVEQAGIYSIASSMRQILLVFTLVVQTLLLPRLVRLSTLKERLSLAHRYAFLTLGATLFIAFATVLVAKYLIELMFGAEFLPCTAALYWMLPGYIVYSAAGVLGVIMQAEGQPWSSVIPMGLALISNGIFGALCLPRYGLIGGAIAYSLACAVYLILQWAIVYRHKRLRS